VDWRVSIGLTEMKGKIFVVTGSNSGIGKETTLGLANMGATVVMVVRDQIRGENAQREIKTVVGESTTANQALKQK
jgi:NAD(P)-dependent dehydrogenase (short-subunit alcohol dehydrogenase family)